MDETKQQKWQGKASTSLPTANPDAAWSLLSKFCDIHLYLPGVAICERVAGVEGQPGCVRYVSSTAGDTGKAVSWAREELVAFDAAGRRFSYSVNENNLGFGRYLATFEVVGEEGGGCRLEWGFECEPVVGWSEEGLVGYLHAGVKAIGERVEEALKGKEDDEAKC
ncbi:lachrymatory-factor synthase-like [Typha latifolia]|uniref:lachrymatory-factor synthase-like n=1 Tax=Typha latifolia TaxID=4733 RepID=UPI003C2C2CC6